MKLMKLSNTIRVSNNNTVIDHYGFIISHKDDYFLIRYITGNREYIIVKIGWLIDLRSSAGVLIFGDLERFLNGEELQVVANRINRVKDEKAREIYKVKAYIVVKKSSNEYEFNLNNFLENTTLVYKLAYTLTGVSRFEPDYIKIGKNIYHKIVDKGVNKLFIDNGKVEVKDV